MLETPTTEAPQYMKNQVILDEGQETVIHSDDNDARNKNDGITDCAENGNVGVETSVHCDSQVTMLRVCSFVIFRH
jgi:hypothetical protein